MPHSSAARLAVPLLLWPDRRGVHDVRLGAPIPLFQLCRPHPLAAASLAARRRRDSPRASSDPRAAPVLQRLPHRRILLHLPAPPRSILPLLLPSSRSQALQPLSRLRCRRKRSRLTSPPAASPSHPRSAAPRSSSLAPSITAARRARVPASTTSSSSSRALRLRSLPAARATSPAYG